ncbi:MAG: response regulator [Treponema sp.]|nr:response regulator [Treponema sp.]
MADSAKNKILIVDDEKSNLMYLNNLLNNEYTLFTARDGTEAIKKANEYLPDLILLDIIMPLMDGYEVLSVLKKAEKTRWIPVIFITGLTSSEDEKKGLVLGADDYINKPFSDVIVQLRIRNQLRIVNQMHLLDRRLKQQSLMTSISQKFLTDENINESVTGILQMIGEFAEVDQILLFKISEEEKNIICQNEYINPQLKLKSRIGTKLPLDNVTRMVLNSFTTSGEGFCIKSNDPAFRDVLLPYRQTFRNYIMTPIFIKGKISALMDFGRDNEKREWTESQISLAILVSSIFSNAFERDSTDRILMETELAEKSTRAKNEFLSRMSHEIRTPLNIIIGMTSLAQTTEEADRRYNYLEKSAAASRDLQRLIDDVLDISDYYDGKFRLVISQFRFDNMLNNIFKKFKPLFDSKQQTFTSEVDSSIPEILIGDERRISHVYENLLSNACKFTQERGIVLLKIYVVNVTGETLVIQSDVIDNGIGISAEMQEHIIEPFEQADGGIDRKFGGAGIGLYSSKTIIEKMEGQLSVESEPGKGSRFRFTFSARIKIPDAEISLSSFYGKTVLLVDDIELNREIVMATFEAARMKFVCAVNGREAVELFTSDPLKFDVILMDINMPEMDGVEATRRIRVFEDEMEKKDPAGTNPVKRIPIIAMTANTNPDDVKNYFIAGMTDHIGKPADFDEVLRKINLYI